MSHPFAHRRPTALEDKAHAEAVRHFAEHLKQFPISRASVDRLERDIAKIGLAANLAAAKPTENFIHDADGAQWHKDMELMENTFLCYRPITGGMEYATVEHAPKNGTNEVLHRGGNATEVVKAFAQAQRQTLQIWTEDARAQVREFLAEKFPGHDMSRVTDSFMHRFTNAVSQQQTRTQGQNHSRGIRI
jgi:hypothetical protein